MGNEVEPQRMSPSHPESAPTAALAARTSRRSPHIHTRRRCLAPRTHARHSYEPRALRFIALTISPPHHLCTASDNMFRIARRGVATTAAYVKSPESFSSVLATFKAKRACAVLRTPKAEMAPPAMTAAIDGGFEIVEFTLTTPGCLDAVADFRAKYDGKVMVGCGTVMDIPDAKAAMDAGAEFLTWCALHNIVIIPGCQTPTEAYNAYKAGAPVQKIFPGVAGGHMWVKAVSAALPMLNLNPTSGVDLDNAGAWRPPAAHPTPPHPWRALCPWQSRAMRAVHRRLPQEWRLVCRPRGAALPAGCRAQRQVGRRAGQCREGHRQRQGSPGVSRAARWFCAKSCDARAYTVCARGRDSSREAPAASVSNLCVRASSWLHGMCHADMRIKRAAVQK